MFSLMRRTPATRSIAKQNGGLNFSVGFSLEEYTFVDGDKSEDGEYLIISQGDLMEVSVVVFPAQLEATMDFAVKTIMRRCHNFQCIRSWQEFCRSRSRSATHKSAGLPSSAECCQSSLTMLLNHPGGGCRQLTINFAGCENAATRAGPDRQDPSDALTRHIHKEPETMT